MWRTRFSFSMLFLVVSLLSAFFAIVGRQELARRKHRNAISSIISLSGQVTIEPVSPARSRLSAARVDVRSNATTRSGALALQYLPALQALDSVTIVGDAYSAEEWGHVVACRDIRVLVLQGAMVYADSLGVFRNLEELLILRCRVSDRKFARLALPPTLKSLVIEDTPVLTADVEGLPNCPNLEILELMGVGLSDVDLRSIAPCKRLTSVDLSGNDISDCGVVHLRHLANLSSLDLSATQLTGSAFAMFSSSNCLRRLYVSGCPIDSKAFASLRRFGALDILCLDDTGLSDDEITYLIELQSVSWLKLNENPISDFSMPSLGALRNLQRVELVGTAVTHEGELSLQRLLPACTIIR